MTTKSILIYLCGLLLIAAAGAWFFGGGEKPTRARSKKSLYDYSFNLIDGSQKNLADFKGKKILIVNVASECGFTPQYEELEKLYEAHKDRLAIIGFPANDFMGQEPGTNEAIKIFCEKNYGVTFTLSQKISVVGESKSEVYRWLSEKELNGWNDKSPRWNFYKYLIDENGELVAVYPSTVRPMSEEILNAL